MNGVPESHGRIEELESRLAFQDDLIDSLNDVVARQDRELVRLAKRVADLEERLNDMASAAGGGGEPQDHEVPPHY